MRIEASFWIRTFRQGCPAALSWSARTGVPRVPARPRQRRWLRAQLRGGCGAPVDVDEAGEQAPRGRRRGPRGRVPRASSSRLPLRDECASPEQRARRAGPSPGRAARGRRHRAQAAGHEPRWARNFAATTSTWTQVRGWLRRPARARCAWSKRCCASTSATAPCGSRPSRPSTCAASSPHRPRTTRRHRAWARGRGAARLLPLARDAGRPRPMRWLAPWRIRRTGSRHRCPSRWSRRRSNNSRPRSAKRAVDAARRRHGALRAGSGPAQRRGRTPGPGRHRLGCRHDHAAPHQGPARRRDALASGHRRRPSPRTCATSGPRPGTGWSSPGT